jgi:histidinol-phosphate/aromatic aminotransferase/cobyric acid decarboxylase-like protein/NDP-sugar pyrophosphorylase family protein
MSRPAKAVILAAGLATRVGAAANEPKPLLPVAGIPLLHRTLRALTGAGVRKIVVVVGHRAEEIVASLDRFASTLEDLTLVYVFSDRYAATNNVYSLWLARQELDEDVYLLDGDIVFDDELLKVMEGSAEESLVPVAPYRPGMTGTVVALDADQRVVQMVDVRTEPPAFDFPHKTASVYLLRRPFLGDEFVPGLERFLEEGRVTDFYEAILADTVRQGRLNLRAVVCERWREIDDATEWMDADHVFSTTGERFELVLNAFGGFQRHDAVDHLVMTNVHFPPESMLSELGREFKRAVTDYPVGQKTMATLLAGFVEQPPDRLVVVNGTSELIKILAASVNGRVLVPVPTYNEYENALRPEQLVRFQLEPPDFRLDVDALDRSAAEAEVELVVVVSPNNPTSLVVPRPELRRLCERLRRRGTILVVDEAFVDFCADPSTQTLAGDLAGHPNLAIVKTLSAVCGIPGLRLGYLLTGNLELAARLRAQVPIYNVNGIAEAFLRLVPRYRAQLAESCARVRRDCDELASLLREIPGVEVAPSSSSFCFVGLPEGADGHEVARRLFVEQDLLVKDCSGKSMPAGRGYLRVKARTPVENRRLVAALADVLQAP